jgi:hypothetical protein
LDAAAEFEEAVAIDDADEDGGSDDSGFDEVRGPRTGTDLATSKTEAVEIVGRDVPRPSNENEVPLGLGLSSASDVGDAMGGTSASDVGDATGRTGLIRRDVGAPASPMATAAVDETSPAMDSTGGTASPTVAVAEIAAVVGSTGGGGLVALTVPS